MALPIDKKPSAVDFLASYGVSDGSPIDKDPAKPGIQFAGGKSAEQAHADFRNLTAQDRFTVFSRLWNQRDDSFIRDLFTQVWANDYRFFQAKTFTQFATQVIDKIKNIKADPKLDDWQKREKIQHCVYALEHELRGENPAVDVRKTIYQGMLAVYDPRYFDTDTDGVVDSEDAFPIEQRFARDRDRDHAPDEVETNSNNSTLWENLKPGETYYGYDHGYGDGTSGHLTPSVINNRLPSYKITKDAAGKITVSTTIRLVPFTIEEYLTRGDAKKEMADYLQTTLKIKNGQDAFKYIQAHMPKPEPNDRLATPPPSETFYKKLKSLSSPEAILNWLRNGLNQQSSRDFLLISELLFSGLDLKVEEKLSAFSQRWKQEVEQKFNQALPGKVVLNLQFSLDGKSRCDHVVHVGVDVERADAEHLGLSKPTSILAHETGHLLGLPDRYHEPYNKKLNNSFVKNGESRDHATRPGATKQTLPLDMMNGPKRDGSPFFLESDVKSLILVTETKAQKTERTKKGSPPRGNPVWANTASRPFSPYQSLRKNR